METILNGEIVSVLFPSGIEYSRLLENGKIEVVAFLCLRELRCFEVCELDEPVKKIINADLEFFRTQVGRTLYLMRVSQKTVVGSGLNVVS